MMTFNGQQATINAGGQHPYIASVRLTMVDGRLRAEPEYEYLDTGLRVSLTPSLSADRRFVLLNVVADHSELAADQPEGQRIPVGDDVVTIRRPQLTERTVETKACLPSGKSLMIELGTTTTVTHQILTKTPYISRLFQSNGGEPQHLCLLVTPRVHAVEMTMAPPAAFPTAAMACAAFSTPVPKQSLFPPGIMVQARSAELPSGDDSNPKWEPSHKLAKLLDKYDDACASGNVEKARKYAIRCLELDPTCFGRGQ